MEATLTWIEALTLAFEAIGVAIILGGFVLSLVAAAKPLVRGNLAGAYEKVRAVFGRSVLLGLEVLVAADIIRTVTVELTLTNILVLGGLVIIRTFLSWSLSVDIEHRWPWQRPCTEESAGS